MSTIHSQFGENHSVIGDSAPSVIGSATVSGEGSNKIEELQKINQVLMRAKEVQYKKGAYIKVKFEKKFDRLKTQVEQMQQQLAEKDKEIKLYQIKL